MKFVAKTDKGLVRDSNQDAYAVGEFPEEVAWAVVCDGMGGAAGGNIASALAVKIISEKINTSYRENMKPSSIKNMLETAIVAANMEVYDLSATKLELKGMGTTVVCAIVRDGYVYIAHAGDSRAYIFDGNSLNQVTTDHSVVQDLVSRGEITKKQAENHPDKNLITRAVGVDETIKIDFDEVPMDKDDILILCTDGLSNYVTDEEMINEVKDGRYYAFAERLIKKANNNGGGDNITVVAIAD